MSQEQIAAAHIIAEAISRNFTSPSVLDQNMEPANVVDVLQRIADGLFAVAKALEPTVEIAEVEAES